MGKIQLCGCFRDDNGKPIKYGCSEVVATVLQVQGKRRLFYQKLPGNFICPNPMTPEDVAYQNIGEAEAPEGDSLLPGLLLAVAILVLLAWFSMNRA